MLFSVIAMTVGLRFIQSPRRTQKILSCSVSIADFLSYLGKWVRLIKFEAEQEILGLKKLRVPHFHPN